MNDSLNIPRSLLAAVIATTFAAAPAVAQPNDPRPHDDEAVHAADQVDSVVDDHGEAREAVATARDIEGVRDVNTARLAIASR